MRSPGIWFLVPARASTFRVLALVAVLGLAADCMLQVRDGAFWAQGVVVDADGRPVPGASVKTRAYTAVTDRRGCFRLFEITSVDARKPLPHTTVQLAHGAYAVLCGLLIGLLLRMSALIVLELTQPQKQIKLVGTT